MRRACVLTLVPVALAASIQCNGSVVRAADSRRTIASELRCVPNGSSVGRCFGLRHRGRSQRFGHWRGRSARGRRCGWKRLGVARFGSSGTGCERWLEPEVLATAQVSDPAAIAVDSANVYWAAPKGVMKVSKAGGVPEVLVGTSSAPTAIATGAGWIFYAADSSVVRVAPDGSSALTLATGAVTNALAVDATSVYWAKNTGFIMRAPVDGGPVIQIASSPGYPSRAAVDGNTVYWVDGTGIMTTSVDGGIPT